MVCQSNESGNMFVVVVQMMIGNAEYQCSCVRYVSQDNIALIVGLSVGLGLLLIIIIILFVVVVVSRRRRRSFKQKGQGESELTDTDKQYATNLNDDGVEDSQAMSGYLTSMDQDNEEKPYTTQLPDEDGVDKEKPYTTQLPDDDSVEDTYM